MALIKLDAAELRNQASEMTALGSEYEHLFSNVSSILHDVNNNWSPNLSNNFSGKISSAQKSFSNVVDMLKFGADAANSSAESFVSIDDTLAQKTKGSTASNEGYGNAVKASNSVQATAQKSVSKKKEKKFWDKLEDACTGVADAVVTKTKNAISKVKKSYKEKGLAYDFYNYGKCALKVASAGIKIAGAAATIATGVGIPIAICGIISAGNDIVNACNDARYIYTDQHDKVGTTNLLKDTLVNGYGELGAMLGYRETGEVVGEIVYTGLDVVSLLNGVGEMLKSLGKVNTVVTGSTGYSKVWGKTKFSDIMDHEFSPGWDTFIRKFLKVDPSSDANIIYEGVKDIYSTLKDSFELGAKLGNLYS